MERGVGQGEGLRVGSCAMTAIVSGGNNSSRGMKSDSSRRVYQEGYLRGFLLIIDFRMTHTNKNARFEIRSPGLTPQYLYCTFNNALPPYVDRGILR